MGSFTFYFLIIFHQSLDCESLVILLRAKDCSRVGILRITLSVKVRLSAFDLRPSADEDTFDGSNLSLFLFPAIDCNFDTSTCGFLQDSVDNFDWTRHRGRTPSYNTGPSSDHTSGSGWLKTKLIINYYLLADSIKKSIRYVTPPHE